MRSSNSAVAREIDLPAQPDDVWAALTEPERLSSWFGGEIHLYLTPGGDVIFHGREGDHRSGVVETVEPGRRLVFWWWPDGAADGAPGTRVEFDLTADGAGGTRLRLVEAEADPEPLPPHRPAGFRAGRR